MKFKQLSQLWRIAISKRYFSSAQNNLTSRIGMEPGREHASKLAIIVDEKTAFTYGDMSKRVARMVALLHSKYKIGRGDRILSRIEKSVDGLSLYLATLRLGAIYVPLNPAYMIQETGHFVRDAEPRLFVSCNLERDICYQEKVSNVIAALDLYRESHSVKPEYGIENVESDELACIFYTSGTTGLPKGAMLSHSGLIWNAETLVDLWRFTSKDVQLHMLPFYHVHGVFISLNCSLFSQSSLIFRSKFDVNDALKWIPKSTVMMGVPTYYSRLLREQNFDSSMTRNCRLFVCGSAPLSSALFSDFQKRTGHTILERYGMTEAAVISSNPYDMRKMGSAGKILPGGKIRLSDQNVVEIKIPSLFKGYWRNEAKTREEFTEDGFFITGDVGSIDEQGFLYIHGRAKDLIISGGLNVYPKEVEDAIDSLPAVLESAVIGVPHADFGEAVFALCVQEPGSSFTEKEALATLRTKLANYKIPKRIVCVNELPKNSMGKVQKNLLRKKYAAVFG